MMQTQPLPSPSSKPGWLTAIGMPLGLAAIMTPAVLLAAGGAGGGFDAIVHGIESRYHAHATRIPFLGLVSGIARISTHGGVRNLHLATFENFNPSDKPVDGDELLGLVEQRTGKGWSRMIRETTRGGEQQTLIYVRDEGKQVGMLIVDLDHHELDIVEVSVNPDHLMQEARERSHHHHDDPDHDSHDSDSN